MERLLLAGKSSLGLSAAGAQGAAGDAFKVAGGGDGSPTWIKRGVYTSRYAGFPGPWNHRVRSRSTSRIQGVAAEPARAAIFPFWELRPYARTLLHVIKGKTRPVGGDWAR